jgi:hypothetical protein
MAKAKLEMADGSAAPDEANERWDTPAEWYWARVADVGNVKLGRQLAATKRRKTTSTPYLRAANITDTTQRCSSNSARRTGCSA